MCRIKDIFWGEISTHALREEGDPALAHKITNRLQFLPTPSARRATPQYCNPCGTCAYFYPRPPRGGRHRRIDKISGIKEFLPTPSARRATPMLIPGPTRAGDFYPRPPRGGRPQDRHKSGPAT